MTAYLRNYYSWVIYSVVWKRTCAIALFLMVWFGSFAVTGDSTKPVPRVATIMSALAPGSGQIYSLIYTPESKKKQVGYWIRWAKLPIIYGAMGGMAYLAYANHQDYSKYKSGYLQTLNDPNVETVYNYNSSQLLSLTEYYRRNRDLSLIVSGIFYLAQLVDAHVDAHLMHFDVSEDLSLNILPVVSPANGIGISVALSIR